LRAGQPLPSRLSRWQARNIPRPYRVRSRRGNRREFRRHRVSRFRYRQELSLAWTSQGLAHPAQRAEVAADASVAAAHRSVFATGMELCTVWTSQGLAHPAQRAEVAADASVAAAHRSVFATGKELCTVWTSQGL